MNFLVVFSYKIGIIILLNSWFLKSLSNLSVYGYFVTELSVGSIRFLQQSVICNIGHRRNPTFPPQSTIIELFRFARKLLIIPLRHLDHKDSALTPPSKGLAIHPSSPWTDLESNRVTAKRQNRDIYKYYFPFTEVQAEWQKPFTGLFPYVKRKILFD